MYKRISVLFFTVISFFLANTPLYAQHIKGQLFVKAKEGVRAGYSADQSVQGTGIPKKLEAVYKKFGVIEAGCPFILDDAGLKRTYLLTFRNAEQTRQLMAQLQQTQLFEYVEQVPEYKLFATPNDIDSRQWNLAKINATLAWDHALGSNRVVLAMVDDAVRVDHEDLKDVIWTNTGEIAGNGIDDDSNGYIDDVHGWDAADNDNNPAPPSSATSSYFTHGTHCAGIAAAATDNATGIASISYNVSLMPVKIADDATSSLSGAWQGVQYAIKAKANVISMSWGGGGYSSTYQQILTYAHNQGIVLVAAAGNNNSSIPMYPAAYKYVISVASTDNGDFKSYFSNYGSTIDVAAPGSNIWSTLAGSTADYGYLSGTSMACPLVSGLTALMLSRAPNATPDEIEACLKNGCDNIDAQNPSYIGQLGAGRINAYKAVTCLPPITADFGSNQTFACLGDTIKFQDKSVPSATSWTWSFPGGTPSTATVKNPKVIYNTAGKYDVTLIASNTWGNDTITRTLYIEAGAPTAVISGNYAITQGYSANLKLDFTGVPPYIVVISDGSTTDTLRNITSSPFFYNVSPTVSTSYIITSYKTSSCSGTFSGTAQIKIEGTNKASCTYSIKGSRKVSDTTGNFSGTLYDDDTFAETLKNIGDWDGDGISDLGASQRYSNDGGTGKGAFWILRMNADGTVKADNKISSTSGNFTGTLGINANFGYSIANIGDVNGDGIRDLASGAIHDGTNNTGVIWILFMDTNRTVKSHYAIQNGSTNFTSGLNPYDLLGFSIVGMGDIDKDGVPDIAASAPNDDASGTDRGAVYIILLNTNGSVKSYQKISSGTAPFSTLLDNSDNFGFSLEMLPDIDNDGSNELVAGSYADDDGGTNRGAIYLLHLNSNGSLKRYKKISSISGNMNGLSDNGRFGRAMTYVNNPVQKTFQMAVTAYAESSGGTENGAAYLLTLDTSFTVKSSFKISNTTPNFTGKINNYDYFGTSITSVNDQDGNGVSDLACSMSYSDDGGTDRGAFYTIFLKDSCSYTSDPILNCSYAIVNSRKVSDTAGGFTGTLVNGDEFGSYIKNIGDWDGDGIADLGASERYCPDGGTDNGALWILCMNANGTVKTNDKISATSGNFTGTFRTGSNFGYSVANIGDIDGDGVEDLGVGAIYDDPNRAGSIWILFMNSNRTVRTQYKIASGTINFASGLTLFDQLGMSIVGLGDVDGDGVPDIAAGASCDNGPGGSDRGAVYIILLNSNGSVKSYKKISASNSPFNTVLQDGDIFGFAIEMMPDMDNDGINELLVCAPGDEGGGVDRGALYLLYLDNTGGVKRFKEFSATSGGFSLFANNAQFARTVSLYYNNSLAAHEFQLILGAWEDGSGTGTGATYLFTFDTAFNVKQYLRINNQTPNFINKISTNDHFGTGVTCLGDYDGNGIADIASSLAYSDDGGTNRGAFYTIFLKDTCTLIPPPDPCITKIINSRKVSDTTGGFTGFLKDNDEFAGYLKNVGDWNGDGVEDLAASNRFSTDGGGSEQGAFWILCMNPDGTVKTNDKISATSGNFTGTLDPIANFGYSISNIGDIDGDGVNDLAVGAPFDAPNRNGAVWILRMNSNRTVKAQYKIGTGSSNFTSLNYLDLFGTAVTGIGDIDNDGVPDIAVNASGDDNGGTDRGAVYVILLNSNGTVKSYKKMSSSSAPFSSLLDNDDMFGWSLEKMKDLDGDGISELLIGSIKDDDGGTDRGAIYLVYLNNTGAPKRYKKLSATLGNFQALSNYSSIGRSISLYTNNSLPATKFQIIVGALNDSSNTNSGAVYLLTLDTNFTVLKQFRINNKTANFTNKIFTDDRFGYSVTCVGDYDGNGVADIAASILYGDDGGSNRGGFYTIFLSDSCSELPVPVCKLNSNFEALITCLGDSVTFIDKSIDSSNRRIAYREWDFGDGKTALGDSIVKHKYNSAGTYTVKLIIASSGTQACRDTITKQITITDSMLIKAIDGRQLCKRDTFTLGLKEIHCASGQLTYRWFPGKWLDDSTLANPVARPLSSIKYYVEVTDQLNRKRTDSIYLDVDGGCCKSFAKATLDKYSICVGDTVRFTNSSSAEAPVTYKWKLGPGAKLPSYTGPTPPPMPYLQAGADTIVLVLSDACGNDTFTTYLTVFPPPQGLSTDTLTKCGDTISYTGLGLNSNKYTWTPNIDISDEHSPNPVFSNSQTRKYKVTIQDPFTTCSVKDSLLVRVPEIIHILPHDTLLCSYDSLLLSTDKAADSYRWPDNSTGNTYKVKQPGGLIRLSYTSYGCSLRDSAQIGFQAPFTVDLGKDTSTCAGIQIILDAGDAQTYLWNTGAVSRTIYAGTQGWYRVDVTDTLGCKAHDSVFVTLTSGLNINLGNDTSICQGQQVLLDAKAGVYFAWNTGANSQSILVNTLGTYYVYARDNKGCEGRDTINVNVVPMPSVTLANDTLLCNGDSIQLIISGTADAYHWSTGSNSPSIWVKTSGTYIGRGINQSLCTDADTVNILTANTPAPNLGPDTTICVNQTILLDLSTAQSGETYTWSDSSNNTSLLVLDPGKYFVTVTGECGTGSDTIHIRPGLCDCNLYIPNAFTPGNLDNLNLNETFKPSACNVTEFEMTIYDRWGEKLYHTTDANNGWDGMYKGQPALEGVYYYLIKVTYGQNDIKEKRKGMVHLLR